jgi:hypothetical protein
VVRLTTRRARACDPTCTKPGDIEIAGLSVARDSIMRSLPMVKATLVCTLVDIGDPIFRVFLGALADRVGDDRLHVEVIIRAA